MLQLQAGCHCNRPSFSCHIFQKLALIIEEEKKKVSIIAEEMVKKGKGVKEKVVKTKKKGVTTIELKQKDADKVPIVKEKKKEEEERWALSKSRSPFITTQLLLLAISGKLQFLSARNRES